MCIHPTVAEEGSRESVDAKCRKLTATWVRAVSAFGVAYGLASCVILVIDRISKSRTNNIMLMTDVSGLIKNATGPRESS